MQRLLLGLLLGFTGIASAQTPHTHSQLRAIDFPDIPGYQTLTCDFHIHTVFSDGSVWPDIRVEEALRDSLDVISITEHLEYQPHLKDIPHPDRNRSYNIAEAIARPYDLLVINGSEITRHLPPGHVNAIFIQDANKLLIADSVEVFREANRQGAFTIWNHANWIAQRPDGIATMTELHAFLVKEGLLHGIEVANDLTYSDEALQIALDYNLTIIGASDIHGLVDWQFDVPHGGHRPITLVFAKEKTPEAVKEALQERRTVAWFNNILVGREEWLVPLLQSSLIVEKAEYQGISSVVDVFIRNNSDAEFYLGNLSNYTFHANSDIVTIPANSTLRLEVKTIQQLKELELSFSVLNAVTAPKQHPEIQLKVTVKD